MSEAGASVSEGPTGPPVGDDEKLYRAIMHPDWWETSEKRISSAAFKRDPTFSVDIASISGSKEATLARFLPGTGLASFACRFARSQGCDVRKEPDPLFPDNEAHAHVYMPKESKNRMRIAKRLALACVTVQEPDIDLLRSSIKERKGLPKG